MTATGILAPARSGVYRTPADCESLRDAARGAHAQWLEVDLGAVRNRADVLDALARAASFPPHFGRNWDALADCLQELPAPGAARVMCVRNASAASAALVREWAVFLEILEDAAMYWRERGRTFIALVDEAAELPAWR